MVRKYDGRFSQALCRYGHVSPRLRHGLVAHPSVISIGNAGGVISSFIYRSPDRPRYYLGHGTVIGFVGMTFILALLLRVVLARKNAKRQAILDQRGGVQWSIEEKKAYGAFFSSLQSSATSELTRHRGRRRRRAVLLLHSLDRTGRQVSLNCVPGPWGVLSATDMRGSKLDASLYKGQATRTGKIT